MQLLVQEGYHGYTFLCPEESENRYVPSDDAIVQGLESSSVQRGEKDQFEDQSHR